MMTFTKLRVNAFSFCFLIKNMFIDFRERVGVERKRKREGGDERERH